MQIRLLPVEEWQITPWIQHCILPWWPKWCLRKHKSRLPCRWSSDGSPLLGNGTIHCSIKEPFGKLSRSAQVWRAPLFSTTITGNLKKAVIEFIAAYGNCYWSLEAQQWVLLTPEWDYSIAPRMPEVEECRGKERRSEKSLRMLESQSFFQVRRRSSCQLPCYDYIYSTAAYREIWTIVQRWST